MNITRARSFPQLAQISAMAFCLALCAACVQEQEPQTGHEPVVEELVTLLDARPSLKTSLTEAIETADVEHIQDLDAFFSHVDELVTWIPVEREILPKALIVLFIINQAPDDALNEDADFSEWMSQMVRAWGEFLDTPASAAGIESFASMPNYNVDDYFSGPSGWQTFNQFFAREVRPGKRPVADPWDDTVIVSPADAVFMGAWPIDEHSNITVKGVNWSIKELLDDSPYADEFRNGIYMHSFLYIDDYHRYHVPVGGVVREIRNIHGRVYMDVFKGPDGSLDVADGDTYQFNQERGLVVIDSPELGLVAVLPIGMSFVSSVNLTPEPGAELRKGEEFGYFMFGGSDIVVVFQDRNVVFDAEIGKKYLQGQRIGHLELHDSR